MDDYTKIDAVLQKNEVYVRGVRPPRTPLEELLAVEEPERDGEGEVTEAALDLAEERNALRLAIFQQLLDFIFQDGPEPLLVLKRVFGVAKTVRPEVLGDMSMADIAIICADAGKATVSARVERIYGGTLREAGMSPGKASCQKKSGKYAQAQKGNQNRVKGERRRKRRR